MDFIEENFKKVCAEKLQLEVEIRYLEMKLRAARKQVVWCQL